ncbi:hypothetical protein C0989_009217, partial [Termitomyces sp. Mn162]
SGPEFKTHVQVLSSVKKEWRKLCGHMNMVVVLQFSIGEEFVPVILVLVAEEAEILFQLLAYALHLVIGLWVVGSGGVELYSEQPVELLDELHHKLWSPIQDVGVGEAMELPDIPLAQFAAPIAEQVVWVRMRCALLPYMSTTTMIAS